MSTAESPAVALLLPVRPMGWSVSKQAIMQLFTALPPGSGFISTAQAPTDVVDARNRLAQDFLDQHSHEFALWIDDDMLPSPDTVRRLIDSALRVDADVLAAPYCGRNPPHSLMLRPKPGERPHLLGGVQEVEAVGFGCTLVRRRVFEAVAAALAPTRFEGWPCPFF